MFSARGAFCDACDCTIESGCLDGPAVGVSLLLRFSETRDDNDGVDSGLGEGGTDTGAIVELAEEVAMSRSVGTLRDPFTVFVGATSKRSPSSTVGNDASGFRFISKLCVRALLSRP